MLISYEWLKELTDTKLSPAELRERLTMVGLAIDAVDEHNGDADSGGANHRWGRHHFNR